MSTSVEKPTCPHFHDGGAQRADDERDEEGQRGPAVVIKRPPDDARDGEQADESAENERHDRHGGRGHVFGWAASNERDERVDRLTEGRRHAGDWPRI